MTAQIPAETLATWRSDAKRGSFGNAAANRILALLDALAAETARAEAAEAKVARVERLMDEWTRPPLERRKYAADELAVALADEEDQ